MAIRTKKLPAGANATDTTKTGVLSFCCLGPSSVPLEASILSFTASLCMHGPLTGFDDTPRYLSLPSRFVEHCDQSICAAHCGPKSGTQVRVQSGKTGADGSVRVADSGEYSAPRALAQAVGNLPALCLSHHLTNEKNPSNPLFPERYNPAFSALLAIASSMTGLDVQESRMCSRPRFSTIALQSSPVDTISANTSLPMVG